MSAPNAPATTVLVADDSAFARTWAERLLADAGHVVVTVADGDAAFAMARSRPPDVLVADEVMPGLSGRQLIRALREAFSDAGIVLMTASEDVEIEADALRIGVDQFLRKPCTADALARAVASAQVAGDARRIRREREVHNEGEMRAAVAIQAALLPAPAIVPEGWSIGTGFMPSRDVGGDVYDVVRRDESTLVVAVGDVSGKGVAGALFAAMFQTATRAALARGDDPAAALACAGALLFENLERAGRFLTATVVDIDLPTGRLRYADAGHGHHLLLDARGVERTLPAGGPPIGFLPEPEYDLGVDCIAPGESLSIFSDGLVEGGDRDDPTVARADLADRLAGGAAADRLVAEAPDDDDRTMVLVRRAA